MIDILIIYEHKARELESVCLLRAELERRGYEVDVMNLYEPNMVKRLKYLFYIKPKVIITPALKNNGYLYHNVYWLVGNIRKIVNLQWEQVFSSENVEYQLPSENSIYVTHVCWGEHTKAVLSNRKVQNAIVTGPIHMDFLRSKFRGFYIDRSKLFSEFGIEGSKVLLFISSFAWTNLDDSEIDAYANEMNVDIRKICRLTTESKIQVLRWIEGLLINRKDITLVYRPHPAETEDELIIDMERKYDNFKVISKYSVKQWIISSDKIYNWMSTSIVETYFANKTTYILRPIEIGSIEPFIYKNAEVVDNYEEFVNSIDEDSSAKFPINESEIKKYYDWDEEIPSYIKICNLIEEVYNSDKYDLPSIVPNYRLNIRDVSKVIIKSLIANLDSNISVLIPNRYKKRVEIFSRRQKHAIKDVVSHIEIDNLTNSLKKYL